MFRNLRLDKHRTFFRIKPSTQPVYRHFERKLFNTLWVFIERAERMPIRYEKVAIKLILQTLL